MRSNANVRPYQLGSVLKRLSRVSPLRSTPRSDQLHKRRQRLKKLARKVPLLRPLQSSRSKSKRRYRNRQPSTMLFPLSQLPQLPMLRQLPQSVPPVPSMVRCHRPTFDQRAAARILPANRWLAATRSPPPLLCLQRHSARILWPMLSSPKSQLPHILTSTSPSP